MSVSLLALADIWNSWIDFNEFHWHIVEFIISNLDCFYFRKKGYEKNKTKPANKLIK